MIGNFYSSFRRPDDARQLPESVLEVLRKDIPQGYDYEYNKTLNRLIAAPIDKTKPQKYKFNIDYGAIEDLPEWAKESLPESLLEYLYRTQTKIPLKSVSIEDENGKQYPVNKLHRDLFSKEESGEFYLFPSAFPSGHQVHFETETGKTKDITIRRVAYDDRSYIKMGNVDFPALSITALYSEDNNKPGKFSVSATPKKAESVLDALISLEILKGYVNGTLKINGQIIGKILSDDPDYDESALETQIDFWGDLLKLEEVLKVNFNPRAEMPNEDYRFFEEIAIMFIDNQDVRYKEPNEYITVNTEALEDEAFKKMALIDKKGFALSFINGPDHVSLLGADFDLYTSNILTGIKVDHIEYVENGARVYLRRSSDAPWMMYKKYAIDEETVINEQNRMQKYYLNQIDTSLANDIKNTQQQ